MTLLGTHAIGSIPRYTALAAHAGALDVLVVLHHAQHVEGSGGLRPSSASACR